MAGIHNQGRGGRKVRMECGCELDEGVWVWGIQCRIHEPGGRCIESDCYSYQPERRPRNDVDWPRCKCGFQQRDHNDE